MMTLCWLARLGMEKDSTDAPSLYVQHIPFNHTQPRRRVSPGVLS